MCIVPWFNSLSMALSAKCSLTNHGPDSGFLIVFFIPASNEDTQHLFMIQLIWQLFFFKLFGDLKLTA